MKNNFLIIGIPRSGTTSLMKSIASANNLPYIYEPFRRRIKEFEIENVVFKTQLSQIDDKFKTGTVTEEHLQQCVDFYVDFSKNFDKVILILRKNTKENAESLSVQNSGMDERAKYLYHNHLYDNLAEKLEIKIKMVNEYMVKLSNLLNVPIDTYENVYYGTGLIDKSISLDYKFLHSKHKQRQNNPVTNEKKLI
jgi:hypothetical protein